MRHDEPQYRGSLLGKPAKIMRLLPIILVLPLLGGCVAYPVIWPYSSERSAAVSGTLLDERTRTPVSGADVFFSYDPKLHSKSDKDGRFGISATRYHYWVTWETVGGEVKSQYPPLHPEITITHTNWATQQIDWDQSNQTILLQKLAEPSDVRPSMTFDGNAVILQDGGAVRYLASRPVMTIPGLAPGPIMIRPTGDWLHHHGYITNGPLMLINVNFAQRVYEPHLTVLRGPAEPRFAATHRAGFSWTFSPRYDGATNLIRYEDKFYVYKLEFIR
jgi:hypothetical protein